MIEDALTQLGVAVELNTVATALDYDVASTGELCVWATGPHAGNISWDLGVELDALGRIPVDENLWTGVDHVWAAGDCARALADKTHLAAMSCQHAMPMGTRAGITPSAPRSALSRSVTSSRSTRPALTWALAGALLQTEGFERDAVVATGASAKQFKRYINRHLIYPPTGDAEALLKLGAAQPAGAAGAALQRRALHSSVVRASLTRAGMTAASDHLTTEELVAL